MVITILTNFIFNILFVCFILFYIIGFIITFYIIKENLDDIKNEFNCNNDNI